MRENQDGKINISTRRDTPVSQLSAASTSSTNHVLGEDEYDNQSREKKLLTDEKDQDDFLKEFAKKMTLNP